MAKILIVDDDIDVGRTLGLLLKHLDHNGVCVTSGEAALDYLRGAHPDLIILDEMMSGMDGMQVLREVRADPSLADLPVVFFSAVSDPQFRLYALSNGATDFWVKGSFDFNELQDSIDRHLPPVVN